MSTLPRRLAVATAAATVVSCLPIAAAAAQHPDPAHRLHAAQATAAADKKRLAQAQHQVAAAQDRLTALAATAQQAVDRYTAAMKELRQAQAAAAVAHAALAAATALVNTQQQQVNGFVRAAYMSGGPLTTVASVLSAAGPAAVLDRASLLGAVSHSQSDQLAQLVRARRVQSSAAAVAADAAAKVQRGAARADSARRTALMAMANQHALVATLTNKQDGLAKTLSAHESKVADLAAEAQAMARMRAEIAATQAALMASWARLEAIGEAMPLATPAQGRQVVKWAKRQLGLPYSWAGGDVRGPTLGTVNEEGNPAGLHTVGFDCSGLTLFAWAHAGFSLDHYTGYQWLEGHHIALEHLRPGDLVFFAHNTANPMTIHHVGIYVGHGRMIDAPHTGAQVRYDDVFVPGLIGAVRP